MQISDHTFMITGGGSGLGQATATLLAAEGAHVLLADVNAAAGAEVVAAYDFQRHRKADPWPRRQRRLAAMWPRRSRQRQPVPRERRLQRGAFQSLRPAGRRRERRNAAALARAVEGERAQRADDRRQSLQKRKADFVLEFHRRLIGQIAIRMNPITGLSVPSAMLFMTAGSRTREPEGGVPPQASMSTLGSAAMAMHSLASAASSTGLPASSGFFKVSSGEISGRSVALVAASNSGVTMPPISSI